MGNSDGNGVRPFFVVSHWVWLSMLILLAAVSFSTIGQAIWRMAQSDTTVTGTIVEVAENRFTPVSATYHLVLRTEQGDLTAVRLRNSGRILGHLTASELEEMVGRRALLSVERELAHEMTMLNGTGVTVREFGVRPAVQLLIGLLPLVILLLFLWPRVTDRRRVNPTGQRHDGEINQELKE